MLGIIFVQIEQHSRVLGLVWKQYYDIDIVGYYQYMEGVLNRGNRVRLHCLATIISAIL